MEKYVLKNGFILSGYKDMTIEKKNIFVVDGIIKEISNKEYENIKTIDCKNKYIMPGLINLHVHLPGNGMPKDTKKQNKESVHKLMSHKLSRYLVYTLCKDYAKTELKSGVTTIRTVGGLDNIDSQIRDYGNKKIGVVPNMLVSNMAISVPGGHMAGILAYEAKSAKDMVHYVDEIAKTKPDLIKLMITGGVLDAKKVGEPGALKMPKEYVKAACLRAHELGYKVSAHVESTEGLKVALEGGVDTIEHGAKTTDEIISLFKQNKACLVCTLSPAIPLAKFPKEISKATDMSQKNGEIVFNGIVSCAKSCLKENITVGLGTDTACPFVTHYDMWRELVYFHKFCEVSNSFAIHTATLINARIAGIENECGSIDINKHADLLILENNPLDNLEALRKPYMVISKGVIIKKPSVKKFSFVENELDKYAKSI